MFNPILGLETACSFYGSFNKLSTLIESVGYQGQWSEHGVTHGFQSTSLKKGGPQKIIWWPDTGDLLFRYDASTLDCFVNTRTNERKVRRDDDDHKWWKINEGKFVGRSYPELFIHEPLYFMRRYSRKRTQGPGSQEATEVMESISRIRSDTNIAHRFAPDRSYHGFVISDEKNGRDRSPTERYRGVEVVDSIIDFPFLYRLGVKNRDQMRLAISSMISTITIAREIGLPEKIYDWDQGECEGFFNVDSYFE